MNHPYAKCACAAIVSLAVGGKRVLLGTSERFNTHASCVDPQLKADILIPTSVKGNVEFRLSGAPASTQVFHIIGVKGGSGCLFLSPTKFSLTTTDAAGVARRFHPYVQGIAFVSQWFVLPNRWSNPVRGDTHQ